MSKAIHKLNIALFHLAFVYSGGGEKLVLKEAQLLARRGHKVTVFVPFFDKKKSFPDLINKVAVRSMLPNRLMKLFTGHESFAVLVTCILAPVLSIRFRHFDCILAANQPSPWIALFVWKLFGVPYVSYLAQPTRFLYPRAIDNDTGLFFTKYASSSVSVRLMEKARKFIVWADAVSIAGAFQTLANGEYIKAQLHNIYSIQAIACPSGADYAPRPSADSTKVKKPYVLITNRHFSQKRFEYGVIAMAMLADKFPKCTLVITGQTTDYTEEIKLLAKMLGIAHRIIFTGFITEKKIARLYKGALVYLYTAPQEDFGMGVVEAMGQGTPVLAWDAGGPSYIIQHGKTGYLAKPNDISDFTAKLSRLMSDSRLRTLMGRNSLANVKKDYSWKRHVECIEEQLFKAARSI